MKTTTWLLIGLAGIAIMATVGSTGYSGVVVLLSEAIASAEGYYDPNTIPANNNNPGDLTVDVNGTATGTDSNGFMVYASAQDGWNALYYLVNLMLTNASHIYNSDMTIAQVGNLYSPGTGQTWANNVAAYLSVSPSTPLSALKG